MVRRERNWGYYLDLALSDEKSKNPAWNVWGEKHQCTLQLSYTETERVRE